MTVLVKRSNFCLGIPFLSFVVRESKGKIGKWIFKGQYHPLWAKKGSKKIA